MSVKLLRHPLAMRLPKFEEWDNLLAAVNGSEEIVHLRDMSFWVKDKRFRKNGISRAIRGGESAPDWHCCGAAYHVENIGFRPAFDIRRNTLGYDAFVAKDGDAFVVGTLYMGGKPVRVPQKPTADGDMPHYIYGEILEMRPALDDPAYRVTAIKVGKTLIADRVLLNYISCLDIEQNILLQNDKESMKSMEKRLGLPEGELLRLVEGYRHGRVKMLPCKEGETIYRGDCDPMVPNAEIESFVVDNIVIENDGTVFYKYDSYDGVICTDDNLVTGSRYLNFYCCSTDRAVVEKAMREAHGSRA